MFIWIYLIIEKKKLTIYRRWLMTFRIGKQDENTFYIIYVYVYV